MPPYDLLSLVEFHPVGQGLFCTGSLQRLNRSIDFHWVYDCGTTSRQSLLSDAIEAFKEDISSDSDERPRLNIVVISHFDKDHISGLVRLLSEFTVDTLLLPYMNFHLRLDAAFTSDIDPTDPLMQFFINPVAYIAANTPENSVKQVIFVPGAGKEGGPPVPRADENKRPPEDEDGWDLRADATGEINKDADPDNDFSGMQAAARAMPGTVVKMLRPRGFLRASGIWEFVPYNDVDTQPSDLSAFRAKVAAKRNELVGSASPEKRNIALRELRNIYDREFGTSSTQRNAISLFLYTGPISHKPNQVSTLYTGDGYLNSESKVDSLLSYLGPERMRAVCYFQVMHHGSKHSWFAGLADRIRPAVSIFSSDPYNKKYSHPDAEVLRDFWPYGAVMAGNHYYGPYGAYVDL